MTDGSDSPTADNTETGRGGEHPIATIEVMNAESFQTLDYDPDSGTYRTRFDASLDAPSMAVISAVAAVAATSITDLSPLHRIIDPDALDTILDPAGHYDGRGSMVSFSFADHDVTVTRHGLISITPPA